MTYKVTGSIHIEDPEGVHHRADCYAIVAHAQDLTRDQMAAAIHDSDAATLLFYAATAVVEAFTNVDPENPPRPRLELKKSSEEKPGHKKTA